MIKIWRLLSSGTPQSITFEQLLAENPAEYPGHRRIIVAKCFMSVIKLKHYGFIEISKVPGTTHIQNISLGPRMIAQFAANSTV
ncbi:unnamed protein product [Leptidea sinapis]|uniref:Uncharacterized protein n=2 Tax=Leptidea sinapis TaxID=189913 RepID=A0A5E4PLR8_9NEOP|nr:unnamed protein product [Leptidea sinapis]